MLCVQYVATVGSLSGEEVKGVVCISSFTMEDYKWACENCPSTKARIFREVRTKINRRHQGYSFIHFWTPIEGGLEC